MDRTILRFDADSAQPDLVASDIAWGRHGLSVGIVVDRADEATVRLMLSEALALAATLTARCGQFRAARRAA